MTFLRSGWARIMTSANENANVWYSYKNSDDTIATIKGSGYFNGLILDLTNGVGEVAIGDIVHCQGSDDYALLRITAITAAVTVAEYSVAEIDPGTIGCRVGQAEIPTAESRNRKSSGGSGLLAARWRAGRRASPFGGFEKTAVAGQTADGVKTFLSTEIRRTVF